MILPLRFNLGGYNILSKLKILKPRLAARYWILSCRVECYSAFWPQLTWQGAQPTISNLSHKVGCSYYSNNVGDRILFGSIQWLTNFNSATNETLQTPRNPVCIKTVCIRLPLSLLTQEPGIKEMIHVNSVCRHLEENFYHPVVEMRNLFSQTFIIIVYMPFQHRPIAPESEALR